MQSTSLRIIVTDSAGSLIQGAEVKLYDNAGDLYNWEYPIGKTVVSDQNGSALFDSLQPIQYYFYAEKGCLINQTPSFPFQIPNYPYRSVDTTKTAHKIYNETRDTTALIPMGSLKYINHSANTYSYTRIIAGNIVVPDLILLMCWDRATRYFFNMSLPVYIKPASGKLAVLVPAFGQTYFIAVTA